MYIDPLVEIPEPLRSGVVAIGNFEGVHRGHCRLLAMLRQRARELGGPAVAVSFDPHPLQLLRPESAPTPLVWTARKEAILLESGADAVAIIRTTREFLQLSADAFFERIVVGGFRPKGLVEGRNFGYGRGRQGDVGLLAKECRAAGISLDVVDIVTGAGDSEISSSRIRRALAEGQLAIANALLGRPHRIGGLVVGGDRRGRQIGFPTANLSGTEVLIPKEGVYAGSVNLDGVERTAACNIGGNPTFGVSNPKIEIHVLDFTGDLYGRELEVDLLGRVRDVRGFSGVDELTKQLSLDVAACRELHAKFVRPFGGNLGQTVFQWLAGELNPSLHSLGGGVDDARLSGTGKLTVNLRFPSAMPPHVLADLLGSFENRLRKVFGELQEVVWETVQSVHR